MVLAALYLTAETTKYVYSQVHMGVNFTLTLYAPSEATAVKAAEKAFAKVRKLDEIMSDYQAKSELNQLNSTAFLQDVKISDDLYRVVRKSLEISRRTDGLFDITLRPVIQLWRQARKTAVAPTPEAIMSAQSKVGYRYVQLNARTNSIRFLRNVISLDLGGIGKGYACQAAIREVSSAGVASAMIEGGGDIYCSKAPPETKGWQIAVEGTTDTVTLKDQAMSTSGSTVQFVEIEGKKYSHIVDPRTGLGVTTRRQVTVIGKDGATVDALATAFCIEPKLVARFREVKATIAERN